MNILLKELFLLKMEKKVHQLLQKECKTLINTTRLSEHYKNWKLSDFENLSELINSKTMILGGVKIL